MSKDEVVRVEKVTEDNIDEILKSMEFEGRNDFKEATGIEVSEIIGSYIEEGSDESYYIEDIETSPSFEGKMFTLAHNRVYLEEFTGYRNGPEFLISLEDLNKMF